MWPRLDTTCLDVVILCFKTFVSNVVIISPSDCLCQSEHRFHTMRFTAASISAPRRRSSVASKQSHHSLQLTTRVQLRAPAGLPGFWITALQAFAISSLLASSGYWLSLK